MSSYLIDTAQLNTKDLIKRTFIDLYVQKFELNKITVKNITSICNISRGTFYFYFTDVPALYKECEYDIIQYTENGITEVIMSTLRHDFEKHVIVYNKYLQNYLLVKDILKAFITGSEKNHFRYALYETVKINFQKTMGIFYDDIPSPKLDYISTFHASGYSELVKKWILDDCQISTEEFSEILTHIVFKGTWSPEF